MFSNDLTTKLQKNSDFCVILKSESEIFDFITHEFTRKNYPTKSSISKKF